MAATNWKEPKLLAYCLLNYCKWVHPGPRGLFLCRVSRRSLSVWAWPVERGLWL